MSFFEQTFMSFALSIDSFFVMAYISLTQKEFQLKSSFFVYSVIIMAIIQTLFAGMGYSLGYELLRLIQDWDHWVIFIFFSYLAWKQWNFRPESEYALKNITYLNVFDMAMMCSIDALIMTIPLVDMFWDVKSYFAAIFISTLILAFLGPISFHIVKKSNLLITSRIASILIFLLGSKILLDHLI